MRSRSFLLVLASMVLAARPALAAPASDPRPQEARKACLAGNVERGIELLAEIIVENGDPNAVYNQGRCYQQNGRPELAAARFKEYLRVAKGITPTERAEVDGFIKELDAEIELRARRRALAGPPAPANPFNAEPLPAGQAPEQLSAAAPATAPRLLGPAAITAASIGALALGTGVFFSWQTAHTARQIEQHAAPATPAQIDHLLARGRRAERLQWWGYGVGAAALVSASVLLYLDWPREAQPASDVALAPLLGPGGINGASVAARF